MKRIRLILGFCTSVTAISAVALAEVDKTDVLQTSGAARSGADRAGGPEMTAPPHASTATGQQPNQLSTDDTRKTKHARNRSVVGPRAKRRSQVKKK